MKTLKYPRVVAVAPQDDKLILIPSDRSAMKMVSWLADKIEVSREFAKELLFNNLLLLNVEIAVDENKRAHISADGVEFEWDAVDVSIHEYECPIPSVSIDEFEAASDTMVSDTYEGKRIDYVNQVHRDIKDHEEHIQKVREVALKLKVICDEYDIDLGDIATAFDSGELDDLY